MTDTMKLAEYWADWLVDAVAAATQNRAFLRHDPEEDKVATEAIYLNGKKAIENALRMVGRESSDGGDYVVRKGRFFYRPNARGYTSEIRDAGRYTREEAERCATVEGVTAHLASEFLPHVRSGDTEGEVMCVVPRKLLEDAAMFLDIGSRQVPDEIMDTEMQKGDRLKTRPLSAVMKSIAAKLSAALNAAKSNEKGR